jgi:hypothetical protein
VLTNVLINLQQINLQFLHYKIDRFHAQTQKKTNKTIVFTLVTPIVTNIQPTARLPLEPNPLLSQPHALLGSLQMNGMEWSPNINACQKKEEMLSGSLHKGHSPTSVKTRIPI